MDLRINKIKGLQGELELPGDKSISHRAAIIGAMSSGKTTATGFLNTGDCLSTLRCLSELGIKIEGIGGEKLAIHGRGLHGFKEPEDILDAGNSATTARLVTGLLSGQDFFSTVTGDDSLRQRPMNRVTDPLVRMGASIWGRDKASRLPLAIRGGRLSGIRYTSSIASAQIKSALIIAGLLADGETTITEPHLSRDHTERMLRFMGVDISIKGLLISVQGGSQPKAMDVDIPADISSAAFFIAGALITGDSELTIRQVGVNQTRTGMIDVLKDMGADILFDRMSMKCQESRADIIVKSGRLKNARISGDIIPRLIDEIPVLAVVATQAEGQTIFDDIGELRVKETDRIKAIVDGLQKMGADVKEIDDGFIVKGPTPLKGCQVESYGDHRIAMAMATAGLVADGETTIRGAECMQVSFPGFEKVLQRAAK